MVEDLISYVRGNTQSSHSRHAGPTQIVKSPAGNSGNLVKMAFSATKHVKWLYPVKREDEPGPPPGAFQQGERLLGKMDDVRFGILCPRFGQSPNSSRE